MPLCADRPAIEFLAWKAGFVSRKRPEPQYAHAERYYNEALALEPSHCPTLGYLVELQKFTDRAEHVRFQT